jgi:hypothetical protein
MDKCSIYVSWRPADMEVALLPGYPKGDGPLTRTSFTKARVLVASVFASLAALALLAPVASAGPLVASAPDCSSGGDPVFAPWLDPSNYVIDQGGAFEDGAGGWSLKGASVVSGNEKYSIHGAGDSHSLSVPAGSSATSATACVGLENPSIRFFARSTGGGAMSSLGVEVLFEDAAGNVNSLPIGSVGNGGSWRPSSQMPVIANLLPLLPGSHTPVQFRFTPVGSSSWQVDDVYVDPWRCC